MTDDLHTIYHLRRALQLLAAYTGLLDFADLAAALDALASQLWHARRREAR